MTGLLVRALLCLLVVFAASAPAASAIAPAESTRVPAAADTTRPRVELLPRFSPTALYSASRGFGVEGGIGIRNFGWGGSVIEVGARLSQRFQSAEVHLYTGDPYATPLYGLFGGRVRTSNRQAFYGLGPLSDRDNKAYLDFTSAQVEARLGWYPFGHSGLLLQPGGQLYVDRLSGVDEGSVEAFGRLDPSSRANLTDVEDETRTGLAAGLEMSVDTRDRLLMTRRGVLLEASASRFFGLDDSGLQFNRAQFRAFAFHPLHGRRTVLIGRAVAATTWGGGGAEPLPFYYLPALDDALLPGYSAERFFGPSLLALGAGLRFPLIDLVGRYGLDGFLIADVGSVYDNLGDQFKPAVSFDETVTADADGRVPLRPSVAFGVNILNLDRNRAVVGGMVGFSPEGLTVAGLRVVYDFRDLRPLFR